MENNAQIVFDKNPLKYKRYFDGKICFFEQE